MKIRGISVGTTMPRPDWAQENPKHAAYIRNKPDFTPASHAKDTNNPHKVTVEQIGAVPESHAKDTKNPHKVTAKQLGIEVEDFCKKVPVYTATPDTLVEVISKAEADSTVRLSAGDYGLLTLVGKNAYPENLTIDGGDGVIMSGVSITSGVKDSDINTAYYNYPDRECTNTDITNAILPGGLTFKNIVFTDIFSLRNASIDGLTIAGCTFLEGTHIIINPNKMDDMYGGDYGAENHNFETRISHFKLTPKNLTVRDCTFKSARALSDGSTHIQKSSASAIQIQGIDGITIYRNVVEDAQQNGVNIGGNNLKIYDNFSSGKICITNNIFKKTADRAIRLYTIKNADIVVLTNQLIDIYKGKITSGYIKASGCENTSFRWRGVLLDGSWGPYSNYVPALDENGNVIYTNEAVAEKALLLSPETGGGIVVEDCTDKQTDYVVAEGTSGKWTWCKWASGIAECWSKQNLTCRHPDYYDSFNFPFGFAEEPKVNLYCPSLGTACFIGHIEGSAVRELINDVDYGWIRYDVSIAILMPDSYGTQIPTTIHQEYGDVDFNVYCIGRWK